MFSERLAVVHAINRRTGEVKVTMPELGSSVSNWIPKRKGDNIYTKVSKGDVVIIHSYKNDVNNSTYTNIYRNKDSKVTEKLSDLTIDAALSTEKLLVGLNSKVVIMGTYKGKQYSAVLGDILKDHLYKCEDDSDRIYGILEKLVSSVSQINVGIAAIGIVLPQVAVDLGIALSEIVQGKLDVQKKKIDLPKILSNFVVIKD